jgi:formate-dependent nitrite reductase membrane component NrfD
MSAQRALFSESELRREDKPQLQVVPKPQSAAGPDYYGIPFLKRPTWKWQISSYFFFGGISGASFALAAVARWAGGERMAEMRRLAHEVSFLTMLPCPALLIWDLGKPSRFYHMLRVWKPSSPMNLGTWILTSFGGIVSLTAAQALGEQIDIPGLSRMLRALPARAVEAAGLPSSIGITIYEGALLAGTSVPVWNQTPLMGLIFGASSLSSAAESIKLAALLRSPEKVPEWSSSLDWAARAALVLEWSSIVLHLKQSGRAGRPLMRGRRGAQLFGSFGLGLAGVTLPLLPAPAERKPKRALWGALLGLAGAFLLRWVLVHAGQEAADDQQAAHAATRPTERAPGWQRAS